MNARLIIGITALVCVSAQPATAIPIPITAVISDRGIDIGPADGVVDSVFGDNSVVQVFTPPLGSFASEERTAVEFPLASIPSGGTVLSALLRLSPQGLSTNLGATAGESFEIHGYSGDGAIQVADMNVANLVGTIVGPTPDGQVTFPIDLLFLQLLVDGLDTHVGFMFRAVPGLDPVGLAFAGTFSGIAVANRPTLLLEVEEGPVIPEPATLILFGTGLAAIRLRSLIRGRRGSDPS